MCLCERVGGRKHSEEVESEISCELLCCVSLGHGASSSQEGLCLVLSADAPEEDNDDRGEQVEEDVEEEEQQRRGEQRQR